MDQLHLAGTTFSRFACSILFSMSYPLAIKNGNGHSPVIIHLHLNSPVFFRISGFPGHLYTNNLCILFGLYCLYNDIQFYDYNNIYKYIHTCLFYFIHCTIDDYYIIHSYTYNATYVMYIYRYMEHGRSSIVSAIIEVSQSATVFPQNTCGCSA